MDLSEAEIATLDKLLLEVVNRRDEATDPDGLVKQVGVDMAHLVWRRYAETATVLTELRDEDRPAEEGS